VQEGRPLVILDLEDHEKANGTGSLNQALGLRFFAGVPVWTRNAHLVGVLCVCGYHPRDQVTIEELNLMERMAMLVSDELELRQRRALPSLPCAQTNCSKFPGMLAEIEATQSKWPLAEDIRNGLKLNQFVLHYQPEVELTTGRIVGLEALIRWQHPERGMIPPLDFIPQAEENGLILPLGDWGMGHACRQLRTWQKLWPQLSTLRMCVNLSARQFSRPGLADHVQSLLLETGLSGCHLGLEMTESSLIPNMANAAGVLSSLHALGVSLHMDDFGTGYSSLSHLHTFEFDVLKVDRSFVQRMDTGDQPLQIVRTIVELARVLGMDIVAEGIETVEQLNLLKGMGCRYGQGYYFSRPLPAEQIEALLCCPDITLCR
jgi:EAL domain-containing protein (putative c-di-GMP-specific phosphodiesterase class I)